MPIITDIGVFVGEELADEDLRELVATICDALTESGYATKNEGLDEGQAKTFVIARKYDVNPDEMPDFIEGVLHDSVLAVIPIDQGDNTDG